ncbi:MAG: DUF4097 family beta strand repeat protein [candidate division Zixibacteria bacterium]|nr:DUF4097 family beta strand repeat protein [candidate division Zixibacteria bacterium]
MYKNIKTILLTGLLVSLLAVNLHAGRKREINKSFDAKKSIRITTISGDCIVQVGDKDRIDVRLIYTYTPEDNFEPLFRAKGDNLYLEEDMTGSTRGSAVWTLTVPPQTRINFSSASGGFESDGLEGRVIIETASGDIELSGCEDNFRVETASGGITLTDSKGDFDLSTASGDIMVSDCSGIFEIDVASGDIETNNCRGEFELNTASGDIEALNTVIEEASSFGCASGDVYVELSESTDFDLTLSSASGRVVLDYNGQPVKGHFEFTAREDRGDIRAPFPFDHEEVYERYDQDYISKSFTLGSDVPEILIETASGKAILEK